MATIEQDAQQQYLTDVAVAIEEIIINSLHPDRPTRISTGDSPIAASVRGMRRGKPDPNGISPVLGGEMVLVDHTGVTVQKFGDRYKDSGISPVTIRAGDAIGIQGFGGKKSS